MAKQIIYGEDARKALLSGMARAGALQVQAATAAMVQ